MQNITYALFERFCIRHVQDPFTYQTCVKTRKIGPCKKLKTFNLTHVGGKKSFFVTLTMWEVAKHCACAMLVVLHAIGHLHDPICLSDVCQKHIKLAALSQHNIPKSVVSASGTVIFRLFTPFQFLRFQNTICLGNAVRIVKSRPF